MSGKHCSRCKEEKDNTFFPKRSSSVDGFASWCKSCFATNARNKYQTDPLEKVRKEKNRQSKWAKNRDFIWEYLTKNVCVDCGINDPRVLQFDHVEFTSKNYNVCEMLGSHSIARIQEEIDKCVVRCANCHQIRTQDQFGSWRSKR